MDNSQSEFCTRFLPLSNRVLLPKLQSLLIEVKAKVMKLTESTRKFKKKKKKKGAQWVSLPNGTGARASVPQQKASKNLRRKSNSYVSGL